MVNAVERAGALNSHHIAHIGDDAKQLIVSLWIRTNGTLLFVGNVVTTLAQNDVAAHIQQRL